MTRLRPVIFPILIVVMLALAGFGIRQVIVSQEQSPIELSPEQQQVRIDQADAAALGTLQDLVAASADPCSVPEAEPLGYPNRPYADLPSLINDVDLIVDGQVSSNRLASPRPGTIASRVMTTVRINDVLLGDASLSTITLDSGTRVMQSGDSMVRIAMGELDICSIGRLLLFLKRTAEPNLFTVVPQGYSTILHGSVDTARSSGLFKDSSSSDSLLTEVSQLVSDQASAGLKRGRLVCESRKTPKDFEGPPACPGETYNPFRDYGFARVLEAQVYTANSAYSSGGPTTIVLEPDADDLSLLLSSLNIDVTLDSNEVQADEPVYVSVVTTTTGTPPYAVLLQYSPATGLIQLAGSGGQFAAPDGFQRALIKILQQR